MTGLLTLRRHPHSLWDYNAAVNIRPETLISCSELRWTQSGQLSMRSHAGTVTLLLPVALYFSLVTVSSAAAIPSSCGSIYKSFAQCLLTLGDSLGDTQKDPDTQDIDTICRSWGAFHVCANTALVGCPGDAAAVWESLRQESRKTQFSGNLYDMCASRTTIPPTTVAAPPQSPPTSDQTNQETLKGHANHHGPTFTTLLLPACTSLLLLLRI